MSFAEVKQEDRRLLILKALAAENDYSIHDSLLRMMLADYGHKESADTIRTDLAWLQEQGLLNTESKGILTLATATSRGCDVADGSAVVPGIRRPRAGE